MHAHLCRACVGKNLATMELFIIIATVFKRYEFVLENPKQAVGLTLGLGHASLFHADKTVRTVPYTRRIPEKTTIHASWYDAARRVKLGVCTIIYTVRILCPASREFPVTLSKWSDSLDA